MPRVHILGAGTPTPTPYRFGSSYVVEMGGDQIMLDCGPASTHKLVKAGLWPTDIDYLFFTHHHFDHDADYPCFLLCRWDQSIGREDQLKVFGPQPTVKLTEGLIGEEGVFAHDWKARVNHPVSQRVFMNRGGRCRGSLLTCMRRTSYPGTFILALTGRCPPPGLTTSNPTLTQSRTGWMAPGEASSLQGTPRLAIQS